MEVGAITEEVTVNVTSGAECRDDYYDDERLGLTRR